jgi:sulfoacetaldehyde dehydrogenase
MTAEAKVSIERLIARARAAQEPFILADQSSVDEAVCALAWSVYKPEHARELAELAVADKRLGNVPDKIVKKQRKTLGTLRDLLRVKSVGIIEEMPALGIVKYAKPVGVVGAVTPSTNPAATPVNKAMMAVKGRNAIVIAPSPLSYRTSARTVELMRAELEKIGAPQDLVQILSEPVTKDLTQALMEAVDLVVVTGSQDNVRRAYASGTPAIGVGVGNVPVIIDETADLASAAAKVCASKSFDDATSCSSENAIVILDETYEAAMAALQAAGGYWCCAEEKQRVEQLLWRNGKLKSGLDRPRCRRAVTGVATTCTELDAGSSSPADVSADRPQRKPSGDWRRHTPGSHGSAKFFWMRSGTNVLPGRPCRQSEGLTWAAA